MSFEKLDKDQQRFMRTRLSEFVTNHVVFEGRVLADVQVLNNADRLELARLWYEQTIGGSQWYKRYFNEIIEKYYSGVFWFMQDIAIYIDSRIPKVYIKKREGLDKALDAISVPYDENMILPYGLRYIYSENMVPSSPMRQQPASAKQMNYLGSLAKQSGYKGLKLAGMSKKEASECIDYFLNAEKRKAPECFDKFFAKNSCR